MFRLKGSLGEYLMYLAKAKSALAEKREAKRRQLAIRWVHTAVTKLIPSYSSRKMRRLLRKNLQIGRHTSAAKVRLVMPTHLFFKLFGDNLFGVHCDDQLSIILEEEIKKAIDEQVKPLSAMGLKVSVWVALIGSNEGAWSHFNNTYRKRNSCLLPLLAQITFFPN